MILRSTSGSTLNLRVRKGPAPFVTYTPSFDTTQYITQTGCDLPPGLGLFSFLGEKKIPKKN